MNPIITVEFSAKTYAAEIKEESVPIHRVLVIIYTFFSVLVIAGWFIVRPDPFK